MKTGSLKTDPTKQEDIIQESLLHLFRCLAMQRNCGYALIIPPVFYSFSYVEVIRIFMSKLITQRVVIKVGLLRNCYGTFTPEIQRQINSFPKELTDQRTFFRLIICKNKSLTRPGKSELINGTY